MASAREDMLTEAASLRATLGMAPLSLDSMSNQQLSNALQTLRKRVKEQGAGASEGSASSPASPVGEQSSGADAAAPTGPVASEPSGPSTGSGEGPSGLPPAAGILRGLEDARARFDALARGLADLLADHLDVRVNFPDPEPYLTVLRSQVAGLRRRLVERETEVDQLRAEVRARGDAHLPPFAQSIREAVERQSQAAPAPARRSDGRRFRVGKKGGISTLHGVLGKGAPISALELQGGEDALRELYQAGFVDLDRGPGADDDDE